MVEETLKPQVATLEASLLLSQWTLGLWKVRSKISDFLLKFIVFDVIIYKTFIKVTFKVF